MRQAVVVVSLFVCGAVLAPTRAFGQETAPAPETRADVLKRAREEKQKSVEPRTPNTLERALDFAETRVARLLAAPDGIHLKLGSLTTGSGLAYGAGFRHRRLFDREGQFTAWAAGSLKKYWAVEGRFDLPDLADGRLLVGTFVRRHSYPQEDFFGVGPEARRRDHTTFQLNNTIVGGLVGVRPSPALTVGSRVEYSRPDIGLGRNKAVPTIETLFDDQSAPGLLAPPPLLQTTAFLDLDYRRPKNARRGGWYRIEASHFADADGAFTFNRFDADLRQFVSILAERRVLAVRLFASTSDPAEGARIPFFNMLALGGHDTMRGFRDYRFRGPHAILTQTEYRFEIWSGLDGALFYDAGKVALRRNHLDFKGLEDAYGFGFRFNTDSGTILRIDAGFGSRDGKHLYIVFGDVF